MPKITYKPQPGDPREVEWSGFLFEADKPKDFDGRKNEHKAILEAAEGNPYFEVEGKGAAPPKAPDGSPTTAEEYRAYAIDWINKVKTSSELTKRWTAEKAKRDEVGWGSDDQSLIDPILQPKLQNLKAAEAAQ